MKFLRLFLSLIWLFLPLSIMSQHYLFTIEGPRKIDLELGIVNLSNLHQLSKKEVIVDGDLGNCNWETGYFISEHQNKDIPFFHYGHIFQRTAKKIVSHTETEMHRKQIVITAPFASNYLWHLLAVSRISYTNKEYEERYKSTIDNADINYLNQHASYLEFGEGRSGIFTWPIIFLPSYLELKNKNEFIEYFKLLENAYISRNFKTIFTHYPFVKWDDPFIKMSSQLFFLSDEQLNEFDEEIEKHLPVLKEVVRIVINNITAYESHVWPYVRSEMEPRLVQLQNYFKYNDIIKAWEEVMNINFKEDRYSIMLNFASKNGPDANSLSYDKNIFYYDYPIERTIEFISHEVGTHIIFLDFIRYSDTCSFDANKLYAAYEVLLMWYNRKVLSVSNLSYTLQQFNDNKLLKRYDEIYKIKEGCTPLFMLETILKENIQ